MSSSDSEDDLITYGTALEPLEEDEIPCKKPRLLEDQVVKDKQGRRRFHGAFTGGFSAGFFNTVGSLEGWTPSLFKSSKSHKQESFQQKPEDFMDEEDLSEFGIAPLVLKAKKDYTNEKSKNSSDVFMSSKLGTYVLDHLYRPVRETVGIKLLKKMGWKPGQGVGPRLNKTEKKKSLKMKQKTYGCQLPPGALEEKEAMDSNSDSELDEIEFAPSDYEPILCEARTNFYGLGYQGLDKRLILSSSPSNKKNFNATGQNRKMAFGSQAFGVGAFEEEDEDIYARDDMSRYDFSLEHDQGQDTKKTPDKKFSTLEGVINGFTFERTKRVRNKYPLPTLPKDFKPHHKIRISRFDNPSPSNGKNVTKGVKLDSESRKKLIENPSEAATVNVNKREKEALTKALISNVKINMSNIFKPFVLNPEKQERYENYLKLVKIGKKECLNDLQPLSMTDWDKERERTEFEKAAQLFKPLTGEMGDRFQTASQPDDLSDPLAVVEKFHDDNDDARKAAKMNMFGPLTRKTESWTPAPLLCKRFNIPEPTNSQQVVEKKSAKPYFNLFSAVESSEANTERVESDHLDRDLKDSNQGESVEPVEPEPEKHETIDTNLNDVSNKADLFKAIFLASDDEDEETEAKAKEENPSDKKLSIDSEADNNFQNVLFEEKLINSKRNTSPPSGIFENIDLELLSSARKRVTSGQLETLQKNQNESQKAVENNSAASDLVYGPKIPEKVSVKNVVACPIKNSQDDDLWVEKKPQNKKHKKKKSKKTSHKPKHKHKKHKR